ncbi:unnamed protein product [Schistosoma curassoni]|uniref:Uncharacterized protein n=1 Tax=Schistosoma curassoni TaxID=6186 RepID=A0A183K844_9TREM|nr:unnamed protein product [Schistosoma curassoni]
MWRKLGQLPKRHPDDKNVYSQLSTQNTSDPLARNYQQQQPTMGEDKPDSSGEGSEEEVILVDGTYIEESTELRHKASSHLEYSRSKEKWKIKEQIATRNGDRYEKNKQQLDRTAKEGSGQSVLENTVRRPMLHRRGGGESQA